jgi:hypothetical protein
MPLYKELKKIRLKIELCERIKSKNIISKIFINYKLMVYNKKVRTILMELEKRKKNDRQ